MPIRVHSNNNSARCALLDNLKQMLKAINSSPVTRQQKLCLYKQGVCPRLTWPLQVEEFPLSWLEKELQPVATKFLKRWAGLTRSANTAILFLPAKKGGLALPSLVSLYKKLKSSLMAQFFSSSNPNIRQVAKLRLETESASVRAKFRPGTLVNRVRAEDVTRNLSRERWHDVG